MYPRTASQLALLGAAASLCACVESFEDHDEFQDIRYLCTDQYASVIEAQVAECREARAAGSECGGVISIRGTLQGVDLTAESPIDQATVHEVRVAEDEVYLDRIDVGGLSPYFHFVVRLYSIGGSMPSQDTPDAAPRSLDWIQSTDTQLITLVELGDDHAHANVRFETDVESLAVSTLPGSGYLEISFLGPDEIAGYFESRVDLEDSYLDGCFHAFVTSRREAEFSP